MVDVNCHIVINLLLLLLLLQLLLLVIRVQATSCTANLISWLGNKKGIGPVKTCSSQFPQVLPCLLGLI